MNFEDYDYEAYTDPQKLNDYIKVSSVNNKSLNKAYNNILEAYRKYINEYNKRKSLVEPDKYILEQPFREVYLEFMNYKKTKVKESTFYDLTRLAEKRILPYFGDMKIKNI